MSQMTAGSTGGLGEGDEVTLTMDTTIIGFRGPPVYPEERVVLERPDGSRLSLDPDDDAVSIDID